MLKTLWRGLILRCPNCGEGHMSSGLFQIRPTCPVCGVRFERKTGESTGASIIMLSILPIPALALAFVLLALDQTIWVAIGIPALLIVVLSVVGYRHMRGLWIAVVALTDGLTVDD